MIALVVLWLRQKSVLDLWLMVAVSAVVAELAATAFVITSRFGLGFYTQRIFSLAASTIVLSALLAEATARLANAMVRLRREQETKIMSAQAITPQLDKAQAALDGVVKAGHSTSAVIDGFRPYSEGLTTNNSCWM